MGTAPAVSGPNRAPRPRRSSDTYHRRRQPLARNAVSWQNLDSGPGVDMKGPQVHSQALDRAGAGRCSHSLRPGLGDQEASAEGQAQKRCAEALGRLPLALVQTGPQPLTEPRESVRVPRGPRPPTPKLSLPGAAPKPPASLRPAPLRHPAAPRLLWVSPQTSQGSHPAPRQNQAL